jgi:phosphatidylinositol alpha-1,6-mannosyltransferase
MFCEDTSAVDIPRTLLVTNDFPPRVGGIQRTLEALAGQLPPDRLSVLAPRWPGWEAFDAGRAYHVAREPTAFSWPTPAFARRVNRVIRESGAEVVLFGDAMPLAAIGPRLAARGTPYVVLGHGFDYWLSLMPGAHAAMRAVTSRASAVLVCSRFIARVVRTAVQPAVPVATLTPGADPDRFRPDLPSDDIRLSYGIAERPLVVCVSRLVARKGQDVLIRAMPAIRRRVPDAALLVVGGGPYERRLRRIAAAAPAGSVFFAGEVSDDDLPRHYAVADVFAMPCRTRLGGLEVEGWGNVFLEAAATGRPVVAGDSGGAREALVPGETGLLVDGRSVDMVASAVSQLLADRERAILMGKLGRDRVEREHTWAQVAGRLAGWLRKAARGSAI